MRTESGAKDSGPTYDAGGAGGGGMIGIGVEVYCIGGCVD